MSYPQGQMPVSAANQPAALILPCPSCHLPTDSMKRFKLFQLLIFLIIFAHVRTAVYTSCPGCMRKIILERTFINIIPANLIWPIVFIFNIVYFTITFVPGPSRSIRKEFGRG